VIDTPVDTHRTIAWERVQWLDPASSIPQATVPEPESLVITGTATADSRLEAS
jgi:hypothetical protein